MILPAAVWDELKHPKVPPVVRNWVLPPWVDARPSTPFQDASLEALDAGEGSAIALAIELHADLLVMQEIMDKFLDEISGQRDPLD